MKNKKLDYSKVSLDQTFQEFLNTKKDQTRYSYSTYLKQWILFTKLNGKETLEGKKLDKEAETEKKAVAFKLWLQDNSMAETSAQTAVGCLRGFFAYHRIPLVFIDSEKKTLAEKNRSTVDYQFTKEDFARMEAQANLTEKYILLVGKSLGLRVSDFLSISYGKLRVLDLESEAPISLGETITQKEHVKAYPMLDSDAIQIVKAMLAKNPEAKDSDKVLDYSEASLTQSIQRLMVKAHIDPHGQIARFHGLRKYLYDKLVCVMSDEKAKMIIGKKIREGAYLTTETLRECYLKAMPSIVINGNGKSSVKIEALESELQMYKTVLKELLKDKIGFKIIKGPDGKEYPTVLVGANKWTELLEKLG
jgi:hypothetical protein